MMIVNEVMNVYRNVKKRREIWYKEISCLKTHNLTVFAELKNKILIESILVYAKLVFRLPKGAIFPCFP